jgi:hypothetical protein
VHASVTGCRSLTAQTESRQREKTRSAAERFLRTSCVWAARQGPRATLRHCCIRLLDPASRSWHTVKAQTKTWRVLRGNHYLELAKPCVVSTVRAVFGWTLRNTGGAIVSRHSVRTASLKVPGPDCKIGIG